MYTPPLFRSHDERLAVELVAAHPFASVVTVRDGAPAISLVPVVRHGDDLVGHLARANPQARHLPGPVTVLFTGPHAYVSPRWYGAPAEHVPTWNYAAVEVRGEAAVVEGHAALTTLVQRFDPGWAATPSLVEELLPAIVAFRVPWAGWTLKAKLSQNRTPEDAARVAQALGDGSAEEQAVAAWMARVRAE